MYIAMWPKQWSKCKHDTNQPTCVGQISVADENDNTPRFRQKNYIFRIKENAGVGKYVGRVVADDADVEKTTNARVTYSFADGSKDSPFTIQPESGLLGFEFR